jgi:hypothetical protein
MLFEKKNRDKWLPVRSQIHTKEHREKKILSNHRQASQIHTEHKAGTTNPHRFNVVSQIANI